MSRWMKAAFLAASFVAVSLSPVFAAGQFFGPPPGVTLTSGTPMNFLQLRSSNTRKVHLDPKFMRQVVPYRTEQSAGTIVINTGEKFLYLVLGKGKALTLWLTDDERKIPVQIKSKLKVGTLTGKLKAVERR